MRQFKSSRASLAILVAMSSCCIEAAGTATSDNPMGVSAPREPVAYLVKEKSLVGNQIFEAGETAMYAGLPSENLQPTCDVGRARYKEYIESNKVRVSTMIEQNKEADGGLDPKAFMANMIKVQAEMAAEQAERQAIAIATAVSQAIAQTLAAMFPNGVPGAAPVAVEAPAPADTTSTAEVKQEEGSGETGAPAKRTKG